MLLSYSELIKLIDRGIINAEPELVNGASIDVRLHNEILVEHRPEEFNSIVCLSKKESPKMDRVDISNGGFVLKHNQFILASTVEMFNIPNDIACVFKLKSSVARAGLDNMLAGWVDPGFTNSRLTLELKNNLQYQSVLLEAGMKIGQMVFYRCDPVPDDQSYLVKGRYNNTTTVTASKGVS